MMLLVFVFGMAIGAVVAHFATKTPIVVHTTVRPANADAPVHACPKCGITGGRRGPFKTSQSVFGHMRACPKK